MPGDSMEKKPARRIAKSRQALDKQFSYNKTVFDPGRIAGSKKPLSAKKGN
jgi:hypothetical protein